MSTSRDKIKLDFRFVFKNLTFNLGGSGSSEGGVGWGMFFHVQWCGNYAKKWSGNRFYEVLGDRTHFLLITHVFERNCSISLR